MAVRMEFALAEPAGGSSIADHRSALDRRVMRFAGELIALQNAGLLTSREIAESFNRDGIPNPFGRRWAEKTVFRMLVRGRNMGLPLIVRSRSEAAQARRPNYSSRTYQREQSDRACRAVRETPETDAVITSAWRQNGKVNSPR